ncbi:ATPase, partial [Streptomyces sp. SID2131]|nr:ATPase [Streptomyces sp. SID2131]
MVSANAPSHGPGGLVVGVDSGGSGLRIALADAAT